MNATPSQRANSAKALRDLLTALPTLHGGTYVVMVRDYWGRASTLDEALRACRASGGKTNRGPMVVWWQSWTAAGIVVDPHGFASPDPERMPRIDEGGCLCWFGRRPDELLRVEGAPRQ